MGKYFNIAGPCVPGEHYMIPALERLPDVARLIDRKQSFVIHAARQSGKTTALMALVRAINEKGEKRAVYFTLEAAQRFPDPNQGLPRIAAAMRNGLLNHRVFGEWANALPVVEIAPGVPAPNMGLKVLLSELAKASDRPLVVLFDEVDCLSDDTLITFLRELRDGIGTNRDELIDRFGEPPDSVNALIRVALLRGEATKAGVTDISQKNGVLRFVLSDFDMARVSALYARPEYTGKVKIDAASAQPCLSFRLKDPGRVIEAARALVSAWAATKTG